MQMSEPPAPQPEQLLKELFVGATPCFLESIITLEDGVVLSVLNAQTTEMIAHLLELLVHEFTELNVSQKVEAYLLSQVPVEKTRHEWSKCTAREKEQILLNLECKDRAKFLVRLLALQ